MSNIKDRFRNIKQQIDTEDVQIATNIQQHKTVLKRETFWYRANKKYVWPVLGASLCVFTYYLFQQLRLRFESESDTQEKLVENQKRDMMAERVGMYKVAKDADIDARAKVLEKKLESRLSDYDMKSIPKDDNNDENF